MALPRHARESSADRCFACSGDIGNEDMAVYLYGAWFHLRCYQRERGVRAERKLFPPLHLKPAPSRRARWRGRSSP